MGCNRGLNDNQIQSEEYPFTILDITDPKISYGSPGILREAELSEIKRDINSLRTYIEIPYSPEKVTYIHNKLIPSPEGGRKWRDEDKIPGPHNYEVVAFLKYDGKTYEELKEQVALNKTKKVSFKVHDGMIKSWYSPEMQQEIKKNNQALIKDFFPKEIKEEWAKLVKTSFIFTGDFYHTDLFNKGSFKKGYIYFAPENTILLLCDTKESPSF